MVAQSWQNPEHWYRTNTIAMVRLHERLRKYAGLKKFVHASTPEVYGNTSGVIREDAPFNPSTPYAISKAACDMNLLALQKTYGFPVALTRAANVCGPGRLSIASSPSRSSASSPTASCGWKEVARASVRSFTSATLSNATVRICRHGTPGAVYHLFNRAPRLDSALVEEICRQLASFRGLCGDRRGAAGEGLRIPFGQRQGPRGTGWQPKLTVCNAIRDTADWIKENLAKLRDLPDQYVHKE